MNRDLGLSASVFGIAVSVFLVGYMLFEIPSNLILARVGARTWLSRIVITWGLFACGCALVAGATSLITMRTLLGIAEAGFLPGLLLYMTLRDEALRARLCEWECHTRRADGVINNAADCCGA